jgi:hypothetical protein
VFFYTCFFATLLPYIIILGTILPKPVHGTVAAYFHTVPDRDTIKSNNLLDHWILEGMSITRIALPFDSVPCRPIHNLHIISTTSVTRNAGPFWSADWEKQLMKESGVTCLDLLLCESIFFFKAFCPNTLFFQPETSYLVVHHFALLCSQTSYRNRIYIH